MNLLIVYGSTEGQTQKICTFLKVEAEKRGHRVELADSAQEQVSPDPFDAVILGASIHGGRYQSSVIHYAREHNKALNKIPGVFVSVSLTAASDEPESWEELEKQTEAFVDETQWHPDHIKQVAGALRFTKYNWFKKFIMRLIAQKSDKETDTSKDHEYTDWNQVRSVIDVLEKDIEKLEDVT